MEYKLIRLQHLDDALKGLTSQQLDPETLVLVDVPASGPGDPYISSKLKISELFSTNRISLFNAAFMQETLHNNGIDDILGIIDVDDIVNQDHANTVFLGMMVKLKDDIENKPGAIVSPLPPTENLQEGALWVQTGTYKTYVYREVPAPVGLLSYPMWIEIGPKNF